MSIPVNDNIKVDAPKPSDPRFFNPNNTPWASVEAVEAGIPLTERHPELRVDIMGVIYWWKNDAWVLESDDTKLDKGNFVGTAQTLNTKIDSILADSTIVNGVTTSSPVPPTGNIHAIGVGTGTYPNWGGMVIPANNLGTLQRVDGVYSVSLTAIDLSGKLNVSDVIDGFESEETEKAGSANNDRLLNLKTEYIIEKSIDRRYIYIVSDLNGTILFKITKENEIIGNFKIDNLPDFQSVINRIVDLELSTPTLEVSNKKYAYMVTDLNGKIVFAVNKKGEIINTIYKPKTVSCFGDSTTMGQTGRGSYPSYLQALVDEDYTVFNYGIGGENSQMIGARQGGIPMYISNVSIPATTTDVIIGNTTSSNIKSLFDGTFVTPFLQGFEYADCSINNIDFILKKVGSNYVLTRKVAGRAFVTTEKAIVYIEQNKACKKSELSVIATGTNDIDKNNQQAFVGRYKKMFDYCNGNVIVMTSHADVMTDDINDSMLQEYGNCFINLREYFATEAIYDAGLTPTTEDLDAMALGLCPPQFMYDGLHLTKEGNLLVAKQVYKRAKNLGYL